tara:strand:- start:1955 stop:2059 length:105 start_codon:yes stop_codon:yes gene_type:complete
MRPRPKRRHLAARHLARVDESPNRVTLAATLAME